MQWHGRNIYSKPSFVSLEFLINRICRLEWFSRTTFFQSICSNLCMPSSINFSYLMLIVHSMLDFYRNLSNNVGLVVKSESEFSLSFIWNSFCFGQQFHSAALFHFCLRVMCKCGLCGSKKQTPSEWERHTGCRAKKWKYSVKVKDTMLPLEKWVGINYYCFEILNCFFSFLYLSSCEYSSV